ncbi:MAG: HemK/PrmC family methyltransferase [Planctomycetota bacterium]|nr:HemK/PrmC family methyltransferase [Planctomycetota bacterium]
MARVGREGDVDGAELPSMGSLLSRAARRLESRAGDHGVARLEAEVLLAHVMGVRREALFAEPVLDAPAIQQFLNLVHQRETTACPVAYLVGERSWLDLDLVVDSRALIPRPETELVAEALFNLIDSGEVPSGPIADRGVGSGALSVAAASRRSVVAVDKDSGALQVARVNVANYADRHPIHLLQGDGLSAVRADCFAAVVANPPYIHPHEVESLPPDVRNHEPLCALVPEGGSVSASFLALVRESMRALKPKGWLISEVGKGQASEVMEMMGGVGFTEISVLDDLAGIARVVVARCPLTER